MRRWLFAVLLTLFAIPYTLLSHTLLLCGESVTHEAWEFDVQYAYVYWWMTFSFVYLGAYDYYDTISFTTCNNETDLHTFIELYADANTTQVIASSKETNDEYNCANDLSWSTLETSSLLHPNTTYYIKVNTYREYTYKYPDATYRMDVKCDCYCDYIVDKNNLIYTEFQLYDTVSIEFNIKALSICPINSICNILHITSNPFDALPKLSINGENNTFIIEFSTNENSNHIFHIHKTMDYDASTHNIKIFLSNHALIFTYDNITYFNESSPYFLYHSQYQMSATNNYNIYLSNPWQMSLLNSSIDGKMYIDSFVSEPFDTIHSYDSLHYILVTKSLNWISAQLFCENKLNASLAVVQNADELLQIIQLRNNMSDAMKYSDLWIGLTQMGNDDDWNWFGCIENNLECDVDLYWNHRSNQSCGYLMAGINNPYYSISSHSSGNCEDISNPFVCDTRINEDMFAQEIQFVEHRSDATCNYYSNDTNNYNSLNELRLGSQVSISFDIMLHESCDSDDNECIAFYFQNIDSMNCLAGCEADVFATFGVYNGDYVRIQYQDEYIDTEFNMSVMAYKHSNRVDLLISDTKVLLQWNEKTQFIQFIDSDSISLNMDKLRRSTYIFVSNSNWSASIDNICINSNMIRNSSEWFTLATLEDHVDEDIPSVFDYDESLYSNPVFYYQNTTIILFNDFMWLKYIDYDTYYNVLKGSETYPYYDPNAWDSVNNEKSEARAWQCGSNEFMGLFETTCNILPNMQMKSQQFIQDSQMGYIISSTDEGVSYLSVLKFASTSYATVDTSCEFGYIGAVSVANIVSGAYQWYGPAYIRNSILSHPRITDYYAQDTCITTNHTHLFFINRGLIVADIRHLNNLTTAAVNSTYADGIDDRSVWEIREELMKEYIFNLTLVESNVTQHMFNVSNVACSINYNNDSIYIFGGLMNGTFPTDHVYKYSISNDSIELLADAILNDATFNMRAMKTFINHNIYLYGGVNINNNTNRQIFNSEMEQFSTQQMTDTNDAYATATFNSDHNIIIKYSAMSQELQYFIPEMTGVDFTPTNTIIWRYTNLDDVLEYKLWDYNYYLTQYEIKWDLGWFWYDVLEDWEGFEDYYMFFGDRESVQRTLFVDDDDECLWCTHKGYDDVEEVCCASCTGSGSGSGSASSYSNHYSRIRQEIIYINSSVLTVPLSKQMHITFLECEIHFTIESSITISSNESESISITPQASSLCANNPEYFRFASYWYELVSYAQEDHNMYQIHVNSSVGAIDARIIVVVSSVDAEVQCFVCGTADSCVDCSDPGIQTNCTPNTCNVSAIMLELRPYAWNADTIVDQALSVWPTIHNVSIDILTSIPGSIQVIRHETWLEKNISLMISLSVVFVLIICAILGGFVYRNRKLKQAVKFQKKHTQILSNPLVVFIGIQSYNGHTSDLEGVDVDWRNIYKICSSYNYELYPKTNEYKPQWNVEEIIDLLQNCATKAFNSHHDSILFIYSGHGHKGNIIASDYQLIQKEAVHRLFSLNYPSLRDIPRIFIFDCCDGSDDKDGERGRNDQNVGKNISTPDVMFNPAIEAYSVWRATDKNPDYQLVEIHGANSGFQSKLNKITGSYLIQEFSKKMIQNVVKEKNADKIFLGVFMDQIQEILHKYGIQQTVNIFHNNTRFIKFAPNRMLYKNKQLQKSDDDEECGTDASLFFQTETV